MARPDLCFGSRVVRRQERTGYDFIVLSQDETLSQGGESMHIVFLDGRWCLLVVQIVEWWKFSVITDVCRTRQLTVRPWQRLSAPMEYLEVYENGGSEHFNAVSSESR